MEGRGKSGKYVWWLLQPSMRGRWWLRWEEWGEERKSSSHSSQLNTMPGAPPHTHQALQIRTRSKTCHPQRPTACPVCPQSSQERGRGGFRNTVTPSKRNSSETNQILTVPWVPDPDLCIGLFKSVYDFIVDALVQKLSEKRNTQGNRQINVQIC